MLGGAAPNVSVLMLLMQWSRTCPDNVSKGRGVIALRPFEGIVSNKETQLSSAAATYS
jgi:hypothetical protein